MHANDWYVRHSRTILHERAANGKLDKPAVHKALFEMLSSAPNTGKRLRALWSLHVTGAFDGNNKLVSMLEHNDEMVRAWSVQLLSEQRKPGAEAIAKFTQLAKVDKSPKVRLYLASALQRLPYEQRWNILEGLASHEEDVNDHNISKMLWLATEPMVEENSAKALNLAINSKMPRLQEYVPRRMVATMGSMSHHGFLMRKHLKNIAEGFKLKDNDDSEGGKFLKNFRNKPVIVTHPLNKDKPARLYRNVNIPKGKQTHLKIIASHKPHSDWELKVKVNGKVIAQEMVSSDTVKDGWLNKTVDLTPYAGRRISLQLENSPNNWSFEHAYWNSIKVISK